MTSEPEPHVCRIEMKLDSSVVAAEQRRMMLLYGRRGPDTGGTGMFERFTDRARRIVVLSQEEARLLGHGQIGTEHLLLALIAEGDGVAARALKALGVSLDAARQQVEEITGRGPEAPSGHIPFTPRGRKVLELSLRESLQLGHNYIGTEHILLGLIREGEGVGAQVLTRLGLTLLGTRQKVIELLGSYQGKEPVSALEMAALRDPALMAAVADARARPDHPRPLRAAFATYEAALWDIYKLSGADSDGDEGPGALLAGMGPEGYARVVVDAVRELRKDYDECLREG